MNLLKSKEFKKFLSKAKKNENVLACILYGSYVKNKQKNSSDLDICIIKKDLNKMDDFEELFGFENIDLTFLHNLSKIIQVEVLTNGKILVLNDKKYFKKIRKQIIREYIDFEPFIERQNRRMIANV